MKSNVSIDVVMPVEEGRFIPQSVLEGLLRQGVQFRLWISTRHAKGQYAEARNQVKNYGKTEFVLMLDNDMVLPENAVDSMLSFLQRNPAFGAIALSKWRDPNHDGEVFVEPHIDMSCVLFRKEVLERITFHGVYSGEHPTCECLNACRDIRSLGLEIGFLNGMSARHIQNTSLASLSHCNDGGCME